MNRPAIIAIGLALLLAGCADYLNNRDTVTFGAGDAQDWNIAVQKVDPWSRDGYQTSIASSGAAVVAAQSGGGGAGAAVSGGSEGAVAGATQ